MIYLSETVYGDGHGDGITETELETLDLCNYAIRLIFLIGRDIEQIIPCLSSMRFVFFGRPIADYLQSMQI